MQKSKHSSKRRSVGIIVSIVLALAILLTGTLAFVIPFQHRSNEFDIEGIRFDATLNENFTPVRRWRVTDPPVTKQINVTNTGDNDVTFGSVFVRLQLREFMEIYNTTYYYWAPNGTTMIPRADMDTTPGQAALFMTDSNNLGGNPSRVFVVAPSTWDDGAEVYVHLSEAAARAQILEDYAHLFPNGIAGHTLVQTTDYISGVTGWFVISEQGDLHGQYGRYMVAIIDRDTDNPQIIGTQSVPRATNVDYGLHEPNGECLYDIHLWNEAIPSFANTTAQYRQFIEWTLGENVLLMSEWDGMPVSAWIIDDSVTNTHGWVYWGRSLRVGQTTYNFLESVRLIHSPGHDAYYVIHTHMYSVSYESLDTWDMPPRIEDALRLPEFGDVVNQRDEIIDGWSNEPIIWTGSMPNPTPTIDLGNGFTLIGRDGTIGTVNDFVIFGAYWQEEDANIANPADRTPLEWLLLDINERSEALLTTKYSIEPVAFNPSTLDGNVYATSNLRNWFNSDGSIVSVTGGNSAGFLDTAFNTTELAKILTSNGRSNYDGAVRWAVILSGTANQANWMPDPASLVPVGDRVFALSAAEMWIHFGNRRNFSPSANSTNSMTPSTPFSQGLGGAINPNNGNAQTPTRTVGRDSTRIAVVGTDGTINLDVLVTTPRSARPAIWVDISNFVG